MKIKNGYLLFWDGPYSQWYPSDFVFMNKKFTCAEQAMMYHKASVFGDYDTAVEILATDNPRTQKALGRQVKNFDEQVWDAVRLSIVRLISREKFSQNEDLKTMMMDHYDKGLTLVEASPYDKIWGIGLGENHPDATNPQKWQGKNLLGEALMWAREVIRDNETG